MIERVVVAVAMIGVAGVAVVALDSGTCLCVLVVALVVGVRENDSKSGGGCCNGRSSSSSCCCARQLQLPNSSLVVAAGLTVVADKSSQ